MALLCFLAAVPARAQTPAQTPAQLNAARQLFADAYRDETAGRYQDALAKYEAVRQQVKDTAQIEYRIGVCEEALNHWRNAAKAYEEAIALAQAASPPEVDIIRGARDRLNKVSRKAAFLTIALKGKTAGAVVDVDQQQLNNGQLAGGVWLDPGHHIVSATAPNATPSRTELTLDAGSRASLTVQLDEATGAQETATSGTLVVQPPPPVEKPPTEDPNAWRRTAGWITIGAGGALILGAGVVYLLRHNDISTLNNACDSTSHECDPGRRSELTSVRNRALFEGPLAAVLGVTGVAAVAVGAVLVFGTPSRPQPAPTARLVPIFGPGTAGAALEGVLP